MQRWPLKLVYFRGSRNATPSAIRQAIRRENLLSSTVRDATHFSPDVIQVLAYESTLDELILALSKRLHFRICMNIDPKDIKEVKLIRPDVTQEKLDNDFKKFLDSIIAHLEKIL